MLRGDLSNRAGVTIGVQLVDTLLKVKDKSLIDKLFNLSDFLKLKRAELNTDLFHIVEHIYRNTDYNIDIVIQKEYYTNSVKNLIADFPFSRIVLISSLSEVVSRLYSGDITYYVNEDEYSRSLVGKGAISVEELKNIIR